MLQTFRCEASGKQLEFPVGSELFVKPSVVGLNGVVRFAEYENDARSDTTDSRRSSFTGRRISSSTTPGFTFGLSSSAETRMLGLKLISKILVTWVSVETSI